jgi:adenosylhomocysteine nucleosidase
MLLIAAAMEEELRVALSLCRDQRTIRCKGVNLRQGNRNGTTIGFLKTGIGPRRSAANMEKALAAMHFSRVLIIGYGGALNPDLKLGSLVVVGKAFACSLKDKTSPFPESIKLDGTFALADGEIILHSARSIGLQACLGDALTSPHVLGNPEHKNFLFERFHASIVDMETAALARICEACAIPLSCIRSVSDEAQDRFLEPFSYNPSVGVQARAGRIIREGILAGAYREWRDHAAVARVSLGQFLEHWM